MKKKQNYYRRVKGNDNKLLHRAIAEKALGHALPDSAVVHHWDLDPANNANSNLVICEGRGYHGLLHRRTEALLKTGNANYLKCRLCKQWGPPETMSQYRVAAHGSSQPSVQHPACKNLKAKQYYAASKQKHS